MATEEDELALIQTNVGTSISKSNSNAADKHSPKHRRRNDVNDVVETSNSLLNALENDFNHSHKIYEIAMDTERAWIDDVIPRMPEITDINLPGNNCRVINLTNVCIKVFLVKSY